MDGFALVCLFWGCFGACFFGCGVLVGAFLLFCFGFCFSSFFFRCISRLTSPKGLSAADCTWGVERNFRMSIVQAEY